MLLVAFQEGMAEKSDLTTGLNPLCALGVGGILFPNVRQYEACLLNGSFLGRSLPGDKKLALVCQPCCCIGFAVLAQLYVNFLVLSPPPSLLFSRVPRRYLT